jgi:hypothetical protein
MPSCIKKEKIGPNGFRDYQLRDRFGNMTELVIYPKVYCLSGSVSLECSSFTVVHHWPLKVVARRFFIAINPDYRVGLIEKRYNRRDTSVIQLLLDPFIFSPRPFDYGALLHALQQSLDSIGYTIISDYQSSLQLRVAEGIHLPELCPE